MAVIFCISTRINQAVIQRINDVQRQFKNAFGVFIGFEDDELWSKVQLMIDCGNLRLFRVSDKQEAATFTLDSYHEMSQKEKFNMQATYFQVERERLVSGAQSRKISTETFDRLGVPREDAQILIEGFPSIYQIVNASKEVLSENSPASNTSIERVAEFFT